MDKVKLDKLKKKALQKVKKKLIISLFNGDIK